jgi:N-acetylglucosaminyldiphosphoundecaprenol N-acetyl-beta-D-mannosaminyltransferase
VAVRTEAEDPELERVDVLGVGVSITSIPAALDTVERWIEGGEQHYVCVTSVHGVMESQRDPELLRIHNESGLTLPDGAPVLWAGRLAGAKEMQRVRGPDLLPALCERASRRGWRTFLLGGAPGTPELLARRLTSRYPNLCVCGTLSPPFGAVAEAENDRIVAEVNASGADVVCVGLSTPKQERWMAANAHRLHARVLVGLGAAFDIHAGLHTQAPRWLRPTGLEWVWRLAHEPRRLWRRYLVNNPRFVGEIVRRPPRLRGARSAVLAAPGGIAREPATSAANRGGDV